MASTKQQDSSIANGSRKEIAVSLFKSVGRFVKIFHARKTAILFKEVHLAPSLRADVISIDWDDHVTVFEVKSCLQDFESDDKWKKYLDYCDYFYFVCPQNTITVNMLPKNVGLIWASGDINKPFLKIIRRPEKLKGSKLNSAWFRKIYKRLAFRRFAQFDGQPVSLDDNIFQ